MWNAGLDEAQAGIKTARRNINTFRWYHPYGRKQRRTEETLDESEIGEWKSWLETNIQKTKIIISGPITSQQIEGGKLEGMADFIFLGSKITADSECSHEI